MTAVPLPPLVDQHCHGVVRSPLGIATFEPWLTEAAAPAAPGTTYFDTQTGFAVRRWCPPLLGLEPHCPPAHYLARRRELGPWEATRRLLAGAGTGTFLVDTGAPGDLCTPGELATAAHGTAHEVVRLETLAEHVADTAGSTAAFVSGLAEAVHTAAGTAIAFTSVAAHRHGLALAPQPPGPSYVRLAAEDWLAARAAGGRLTDPVLLRHLLWNAVATGLPLQLHTGAAGPAARPERADPALFADFARATDGSGAPLVLLHGYPYHRQAAHLANVFPHVYADIGLAVTLTGSRAAAILAETLELAPFGKLMFSTGARGLPELHVTGARLFTTALHDLLDGWVAEGAWSAPDAARVAAMLVSGNARRVYGLP